MFAGPPTPPKLDFVSWFENGFGASRSCVHFRSGGMMQDDVNAPVGNEPEEAAPETAAGILFNWQTGVGFFLSAIVGTILARLADRPIIDGILVLTSCAAVCVLALRLVPPAANTLRLDLIISQPLRELLDSAGPAIEGKVILGGRISNKGAID